MQQTIQSLSALERRVDLTVPAAAIEQEVKTRLAKLARDMKMPGFRPGKVPIKMVAQTYGAQVQAEVLNDKVGEAFNSAVTASNLKVAGQPRLEARTVDDGENHFDREQQGSDVFSNFRDLSGNQRRRLVRRRSAACNVSDRRGGNRSHAAHHAQAARDV